VFQSGVDCTEEVSSLFRGELNPVAAKAQKKVQIPEGFVQHYLLLFLLETRNMSDRKPTFRCILRHYQGYIINDKKRFVKRLS